MRHRTLLAILLLFLLVHGGQAQIVIRGTVFDMSRTQPLEAVSVLATSGQGSLTDINGHYTIRVGETDSIWFSYLNKSTPKFAVTSIANLNQFDISVHVASTLLKEVRVMPRDYKFDSAQNRKEYAKVFNFRKPGLSISSLPMGSGGAGVGLDLDELINVFRFKRTRSMLGFQRRLLMEEEDKFIDHRFSKSIVREITLLSGDELNTFMKIYRPDYEFTRTTTDYEFYDYIKKCYLNYRAVKGGF